MTIHGIDVIPIIEVIRLQDDDTCGMLGVMRINKQIFCYTLEPPERGNQINISCIPEGQYPCERYFSSRFKRHLFRIQNVPFRTACAIHSGRHIRHTQGCILIGSSFEKLIFERQLSNSGQTLEKFMEVMDGFDRLHLTIKNQF